MHGWRRLLEPLAGREVRSGEAAEALRLKQLLESAPDAVPPAAGGFRSLIQSYYRSAAIAVDENGGIVDKFLGDGVMALFIPVIAGENHAERAIAAGRAILAAVERDGLVRKGLMVGAGVHTGEAFVGVVGGAEKTDFTALGDTVNIAARLGGVAGPGELVVSRWAWDRAGLGVPPVEREVQIAGRTGNLAVVSIGADVKVAEPAARH